MINWETISYSVESAKKDFNELEVHSNQIKPIDFMDDFNALRLELLEARDSLFENLGLDKENKLDYVFDLYFGLKLYTILNEQFSFTNRIATNDDIWRYLSVKVVPDIVHSRWGFNEDRFYRLSRRNWLKTIWWYICLSWKGNEQETLKILEGNTTDTIMQLVERPGLGYHIDLYRALMSQYAEHADPSRELFRSVLKLNTARLLTITPELIEGGVSMYVSNLFSVAKEKVPN